LVGGSWNPSRGGDILCLVEIQRRALKSGAVRWRQGDRYRSQTFDREGDAVTFSAEIRRRQQLGTLASMDSGRVTLAEYVIKRAWLLQGD
jgi:hypothetical protein